MIFDRLWWAERATRKREQKRREKRDALFAKVRSEKYENAAARQNAIDEIEHGYYVDSQEDDDFDVLSTEVTVKTARKLGIPLPRRPRPGVDLDYNNAGDVWYVNDVTWNTTLTEAGQFQIRQAIRKEQIERLQHRMRWVSIVASPLVTFIMALIALFGAITSFIAVRHLTK